MSRWCDVTQGGSCLTQRKSRPESQGQPEHPELSWLVGRDVKPKLVSGCWTALATSECLHVTQFRATARYYFPQQRVTYVFIGTVQARFYDFCVLAGFCKYDMACEAENRSSHSSGLDVLPVNRESTLLKRG